MPEFEAIIPNKTGNFFTENSIQNLVESISKWFSDKNYSRERIRQYCYKEIDNFWTPKYQLDIIKKHLS